MLNLFKDKSELANEQQVKQLVDFVLLQAKQRGLDEAELSYSAYQGVDLNTRQQSCDSKEFNQGKRLVLTVYKDSCKASVSTTATDKEALTTLLNTAVDLVKLAEPDEYCGLAAKDLLAWQNVDLNLYHPTELDLSSIIELSKECEQVALNYDKRIVNSEGVGFSANQSYKLYANTHSIRAASSRTGYTMSCSVVAKDTISNLRKTSINSMERDYCYSSALDKKQLLNHIELATRAASRAVARLRAQRIKTRQVPVIFSHRVSTTLINHLLQAISGSNLYKRSSFLLDKLNHIILPEFVSIREEPLLPKGISSAYFDADGVATKAKYLIERGSLNSYLLSNYSAKRLGMQTTANAGGVFNLLVEDLRFPFADSHYRQNEHANYAEYPPELLKEMGTGLFITELMGQGVDIVTGEYSRGATGFWVENGVIQYPVSEITVAGNLIDMFKDIRQISSDASALKSIQVGSILLNKLTVAGS